MSFHNPMIGFPFFEKFMQERRDGLCRAGNQSGKDEAEHEGREGKGAEK